MNDETHVMNVLSHDVEIESCETRRRSYEGTIIGKG